jgi:hypothetical protein
MNVIYLETKHPAALEQALEALSTLSESTERLLPTRARLSMTPTQKVQARLLMESLHADIQAPLVAVSGFDHAVIMPIALSVLMEYAPNRLADLADVLMIASIRGDDRLRTALEQHFQALPSRLLETARMMVLCEGEAKRAAQVLYLHRNTFNYRLHQFMDRTGVDVREDAMRTLMRLYLSLSEQR